MKTFTAKTRTGKELKITDPYLLGGKMFGKIGDETVAFDSAIKDGNLVHTIYLQKEQIKSLLGADSRGGGHVILTESWRSVYNDLKKIEDERKAAELAPLIKKANEAKITAFVYRVGCDAASDFYFEYEDTEKLPWEAKCERNDRDKGLIESLKKMDLRNLAKKHNAEELPGDGMSYGAYRFIGEGLMQLIEMARSDFERKEAEKKAEKERVDGIFAKAKETGKKQQLYSGMDECNDPREDCSFDTIIVYAMPDGTTTESRHHCY